MPHGPPLKPNLRAAACTGDPRTRAHLPTWPVAVMAAVLYIQ